jgi:hypothetical protein
MNLQTSLYETTEAPSAPTANARKVGKTRWRIPNDTATLKPVTPQGWITAYFSSPSPFAGYAPNEMEEGPQMARQNQKTGMFTLGIPNAKPGDRFILNDEKGYEEYVLNTASNQKLFLARTTNGPLIPVPVLT